MNVIDYTSRNKILQNSYEEFLNIKDNLIGYPENQKFDYSEITKFFKLSMNTFLSLTFFLKYS